jgi:hypothetical protein
MAGIQVQEQLTAAQANTGVASSGFLAGATWIVDLAPVLQVAATAAALIVALIAGWYKIEQIRDIRDRRKEK